MLKDRAEANPEAIWAPWRSRKLLAVLAVARASARVRVEGSAWALRAVVRAACFWAQVVPWVGAAAAVSLDGVDMREKRDWSSLSWEGVALLE